MCASSLMKISVDPEGHVEASPGAYYIGDTVATHTHLSLPESLTRLPSRTSLVCAWACQPFSLLVLSYAQLLHLQGHLPQPCTDGIQRWGRVPWEEARPSSTEKPVRFLVPPLSLVLGLLLNGVVLGPGRCGQAMYRGRAAMLGAQGYRPSLGMLRMALIGHEFHQHKYRLGLDLKSAVLYTVSWD